LVEYAVRPRTRAHARDLTLTDLRALGLVKRGGPMRPGELARALQLSAGGTTGVILALMVGCLITAAALLTRPAPGAGRRGGRRPRGPRAVGRLRAEPDHRPAGSDDDIGNWSDPLGLVSLWVEALTLGLALLRQAALRRSPTTTCRPSPTPTATSRSLRPSS
jgi:hypothetical protein